MEGWRVDGRTVGGWMYDEASYEQRWFPKPLGGPGCLWPLASQAPPRHCPWRPRGQSPPRGQTRAGREERVPGCCSDQAHKGHERPLPQCGQGHVGPRDAAPPPSWPCISRRSGVTRMKLGAGSDGGGGRGWAVGGGQASVSWGQAPRRWPALDTASAPPATLCPPRHSWSVVGCGPALQLRVPRRACLMLCLKAAGREAGGRGEGRESPGSGSTCPVGSPQ